MRENGITSGRERTGVRLPENGEAESSRHGKVRMDGGQLGSEELVEAERASLVAEKQAKLATVLDSHDSLVREMFHMDTFVNMIEYDPKEAKKDHTKIFQNYKAEYDLVNKAVSSSNPSRATRRSREEQIQLLKPPSLSAPSSLNGRKKPKGSGYPDLDKIKGKTRLIEPRNPAVQSVAPEMQQSKSATDESISATHTQRDLVRKKGENLTSHSTPGKKRRVILSHPGEILGRKSSRLNQHMAPLDATDENICMDFENQSNLISVPPPTSQSRAEQQGKPVTTSGLPPPSKFNIKRVRLLVRRPPPPITNPKQRPPQAKHNFSVNTLLSSYFTLDDIDIDDSSLAEKIHANARLLERTEKLKQQGRFVPDQKVILDLKNDTSEPIRRSKDHWDHVVEASCHLRRQWTKRTSGAEVAGHVAKLVRGYWDGQEARKEKLKIQEDRRLRVLAKATIKIVADEWKKAVFHIREQERLKREAEEVRRGRAHLDAILNQSGQLLETQQGDLSRGDISRSRSASLSISHHEWTTDDDENSDTDGVSAVGESLDGQETDEGEIELVELPKEETDLDERSSEYDDSESNADALTDLDRDSNTHMLLADLPSIDSSGTAQDSSHQNPPPSFDSNIFGQDVRLNESFGHSTEESINGSADGPSPPLSSVSRGLTNVIVELGPEILKSSPQAYSKTTPENSPKLDQTLHPVTEPPFQQMVEDATVDQGSPPERHTSTHSTTPVTSALLTPDSSNLGSRYATPESAHLLEGATPDNFFGGTIDESSSIPPDSQADPTHSSSLVPSEVENGNAEKMLSAAENLVPNKKTDAEISTETEAAQGDTQSDTTALNIPNYLKPYAVARVEWKSDAKIVPPLLLRGILRPYQQSGLEWLASLHINNLNGILADEMGLGKTIQTIALLAHLACDRGIWGPHLIIVPTSVLLNWEMEFKKFLPGFRVLSYHGGTKRRKELRQGWNDKHHFNVCITSYTLASRDAHIFKRKAWYYMILDEAHMIKNFKSQRWNILLMFRSFRRLLLTGTPLQNNLTELWALLQFLMSGSNFASLKDFGDWFSNPLEKAIEMGNTQDEDTLQRVSKLHTVLRPYLLRRLKIDVEKELPSKYEHLVVCPLSKRQRFLYDEFMARSHTREALRSGVYQKIANVLMQLRKVCNHPDLFEVRPIVTSLALERSAIADFEIKELLIRRRMLDSADDAVNFGLLGLQFVNDQDQPLITALETRRLDASSILPFSSESPGEAPPKNYRTISGFKKFSAYMQQAEVIAHWSHIRYLNRLRCANGPIYGSELLNLLKRLHKPLLPVSYLDDSHPDWETIRVTNAMIKSYDMRSNEMSGVIDRFAFATPATVALDLPRLTFPGCETVLKSQLVGFDSALHRTSVKLQIAFPDPSLIQYDCGKLQELANLLREKKANGHRVLMFTQMTKILDILEIFLNYHGYLYLRLDGATKIEDRQYITERFNADARIFCFIASSRSGGVGINLTGADTVVFYDSDFNPQMDRQCEDRAHRIGQIRDVHIYRFVCQHTVEEALLRKANQKRFLDDLVIQKGEFDWRSLFNDESALSKALEEFEDREDVHAAAVAATEEVAMLGADEADFSGDFVESVTPFGTDIAQEGPISISPKPTIGDDLPNDEPEAEDEGGSVVEYMINFVQQNWEFFKEWRL